MLRAGRAGDLDFDDLTLLKDAGYAYDHGVDPKGEEPIKRYWAALMCDLAGLPSQHQQRIKTYELVNPDPAIEPHPIWWGRMMGHWPESIGPFTKVLLEMSAINEVWNLAFGTALFKSTERPPTWGWVLRSTSRDWEGFILTTSTLLIDGLSAKGLDAAGAPQGAARDLLAGTQLVQARGYAGRRTNGDDELDAVWSRDGRDLVFVATTNEDRAAYDFVSRHLYRVAAAGGEPAQLTSGADSYGRPLFSADGRRLFARYERRTGKVYNIDNVVALGWPQAGAPLALTAPLDRPVDSFAVSPDGRTLWFLAEDQGRTKLFSTPTDKAAPRLAYPLEAGSYSGLSLAAGAKAPVLAATWESAVHPPEVARLDPRARRHVQLTAFNDARAAGIDWQPLREFWTTNRRGEQVHSFLALPPGFDAQKKYPLLVLMHGGPHSMWADSFGIRWNPHLLAAPGFVVVMTDYKGSTGYGEAFAQSIQGDPLRGPADDINDAADEAIKRFGFIDGNRQCAGGASYGGHLANWMQASTTRYRCLVSHAGLLDLRSQWGTSDVIYHREVNVGSPPWSDAPLWKDQSPFTYAGQFKTPVLLTIGEKDFRVPINNTLEYWSVLQRQQVPSRLLVFPDANHWILGGEDSRYFYGEVQAWLSKYLKD